MVCIEKVDWAYTQQGGYNYIIMVAAIVVKRNHKTVKIAVWSLTDKCIKYRNVKPENLAPREQAVPELDEAYAAMMRARASTCRMAQVNRSSIAGEKEICP